MRISVSAAIALFTAPVWLATAGAAVVHDEALAGDLADDGLLPTLLSLAPGSNQVFGTTGFIGTGLDRDYFTLTVPAGTVLSKIVLLPGSEVAIGVSFLGLQAGNAFTIPPDTATAAGMLGWTHYTDPGPGGTDLLPAMSMPNLGSSGFESPLAAGAYSFWVQDFDGLATYGFDFVVTPLPGSVPLLLSGLALLGGVAHRRRLGADRAGAEHLGRLGARQSS